jgi:hypothetical protein
MKGLARAREGAIAVEYLVAFLPVMFFFASVWQIADLYAGHLVVQRAASAAGRAASVVIPDDPFYYGGQQANTYGGMRQRHVELSALLVLDASSRILANPQIQIDGASGTGPLTARVTARFRCFPGWGVFVCGPDGTRTLTASARYPYHGASYKYP